MDMNYVDRKYELITQGLQEIFNGTYLRKILETKDPVIYWGTAPTGRIHVGYFVPLLKIKDFVNAGCTVKILIADIHAFLDNLKCPFEKIELRSEYYIKMIKSMLSKLNVDLTKITFVKGSEYQLEKKMILDLFKLASITSVSQAQHAGAEVVKKSDDPKLTGLLYPLLQALDESYLDADAELGGIDQRKIFGYSKDFGHKIGITKKFIHLMNPVVPGLVEGKMSSSDNQSKIDLLETEKEIKKKISKVFCEDGNVEQNSILELIKNLIFKLTPIFTITRPEQYGGNVTYTNIEDLKIDVAKGSANGGIHPGDLKNSFVRFIVDYLEPIRKDFESEENKSLVQKAYS